MTEPKPSTHLAETTKTPSARALYSRRDAVLQDWIGRVKNEVPTAAKLLEPTIVNTIPLFIERLAQCLCEEFQENSASESANVSQEHGGERARVTLYGPEQVLQEYQILREVVRAEILAVTPLTAIDERVIQRSFDKGIQEAMIAYFLVHGRIREHFVAGLTHDLRNPIGAMKMAADLVIDLIKEAPTPESFPEIQLLNERILKLAKRADRMIQNMLDASVVQAGEELNLNLSPCNLSDIVREAIGERSSKEVARLKTDLIDISGHWDFEALQRSIENLIANAFKYGDANLPVTVRTRSAHGRAMVSVHNFGNPIPGENLETLFQVFRRAESAKSGAIKGWGIGLALSRTTAERLGGSLGVISSTEDGTTFTIDIPCDSRPFQNAPTSR